MRASSSQTTPWKSIRLSPYRLSHRVRIKAVALSAPPGMPAAKRGQPPVDVVHDLSGINQADGKPTPVAPRTFDADLALRAERR